MVDLGSRSKPLTVQLPADLIDELQNLAKATGQTVDDVVCDACLSVTEAHGWEECFQQWCRDRTGQSPVDQRFDVCQNV